MDENLNLSPEEVMQMAARQGIELGPEALAAAHEAGELRRQQLEAATTTEQTKLARFVTSFNRFYPRFLQTLIGIGEVLITLTQTVLIAFGVPGVLLMLLVVEQQRVYHGVSLFEINEGLAGFSALSLVILNLILELLISYVEHTANWHEPARHDFSFRILAQRIGYILGRDTAPREKSPAIRFRIVLRIVTFSILTLALAGSMKSVIQSTDGTWLDALRKILIESSLLNAATWAGGLLFAVAAVLSAQALSQYVAVKVVEIVSVMQSRTDDKPRKVAEAAGLTAAAVLMARLKQASKQRRTAAMVSASDVPNVGVSGRISVRDFVPTNGDVFGLSQFTSQDDDGTAGQMTAPRTKVDTAFDMLKSDRTLRKLSVRDLEERYPDIRRNTWSTAKRRLGL